LEEREDQELNTAYRLTASQVFEHFFSYGGKFRGKSITLEQLTQLQNYKQGSN